MRIGGVLTDLGFGRGRFMRVWLGREDESCGKGICWMKVNG